MDTGHSRLLKFIVKDNSRMEKHTLKIENLAPSDIESEVPRHQKLREETLDENIKEQPTHRTEPESEGQIEWSDVRDMIKKPVYMGLQEEVIRTPHQIRAPKMTNGQTDKTLEDSKPQTRIPVSKFKPTVERVLKERKDAPDVNTHKRKREAPEKPRRSSIPKLKDRVHVAKKKYSPTDDGQPVQKESSPAKAVEEETKDETVITNLKRVPRKDRIPVMSRDNYKLSKKVDGVKKPDERLEIENTRQDQTSDINDPNESIKTESTEMLDDEFDKLYEEIVDTDAVTLPDEILETKVKDPEKLEIKFEEIVHQDDEQPVEQVKIEPVDKARYSKIPLLRRRSSHDVNVPRQYERRLSLKTSNVNRSTLVKDQKSNDSTVKTKHNDESNSVSEDNKVQVFEDTVNETAQNGSSNEINNNNENDEDRYIVMQSPDLIPDYNTIATPDSELVKVGIFGISRNIPLEETNQSLATPEIETVKVAVMNISAEEPLKYIDKDIELVEAERVYITDEVHDDKAKEEIDAIDDKNMIEIETIKEELLVDHDINQVNTPPPSVFINSNDELKTLNLLKNTNTIEERNKSRYINKPLNEETNSNNVAKLEEDIPTIKGKVSRILSRLSSQEHPNNNNDEEIIDTKKETNNIPKKKSVLSKIAMFERGDPELSLHKKPTHKYSKPKRTISEEKKHRPKIVQEVLKPKGVPTDKHTFATVDILRPVEVITNNEEQITVVENLKEVTVTYDNFDDARLNKINTIEFEPESPNNANNEIILTDISINYDNDNNYNTFKDRKEDSEAYANNENDKENLLKEHILKSDNHYQRTPLESNKSDKEKWKSTDAVTGYLPVKEKINRLISHEDSNMKRAKSTAELDLGDAVKGKVKKLVVRMNSCEMLDGVKPKEVEVISAKERPRKRSVLEKIAMFEASYNILHKYEIDIA